MKKMLSGLTMVALTGLTGCQPMESLHASSGQLIDVDKHTRLVVEVEGVQARPTSVENADIQKSRAGESIHRILQSGDGKVLFAYDLKVGKGDAVGTYRFVLEPSAQGPTFQTSREVTVKAHEDAVRVELMEQPGTSRKVVDVFRLVDATPETRDISFGAHMRKVHSLIRQWVHGE